MIRNNHHKDIMNDIVKRKPGRPSKSDLEATKRKVGRPKETVGRIAEFKQRLLATSGTHVIDKIVSIAQDDDHPGQMAALKMCIDRILPISLFEKGSGQKPTVQINIVNATQEKTEDVIIDINGEDISDIDSEDV